MSGPRLLPLDDEGAVLRAWPAPRPRAAFLFMPGGGCAAFRYDWLNGLNAIGVSTYILDAGTAFPGLRHFLAAVALLRAGRIRLFVGGHSAGAATVLDALDPEAGRFNPRIRYPDPYSPPAGLAGVAVLGCSLQPKVVGMVLPHRFEARPLSRPTGLRMMFLTGHDDLIATPELVERTRRRYGPPTAMASMMAATHYGWTTDPQPTDNPAFDRAAGADVASQRARGLAYLAAWMKEQPFVVAEGDQLLTEYDIEPLRPTIS